MKRIYVLVDTNYEEPPFASYFSEDLVLKAAELVSDKVWEEHFNQNKPKTREETRTYEIHLDEIKGLEDFIWVEFDQPSMD